MTTTIAIRQMTGVAVAKAEIDYDTNFTALYEAHYTRIFAFVYSRVHDVELSKDLVSIVFEKAYVKGREVRNEDAYGAWLFMVARNAISGHFRKLERDQRYTTKAGDELRFASMPGMPEDALLRDERVGQLIKHIATLPRRDRELLSLKFDAELMNVEIAKVLSMSVLNVRVSIFRALRKLRKRFESEDDEAA